MNDYLISLFIDDEMDLDEKIVFVKTVHADREFSMETVVLLEQEKHLSDLPAKLPASVIAGLFARPEFSWSMVFRSWRRPIAGFAAAMILVGLGFLLIPNQQTVDVQAGQRFVLYLPLASQAKIVGTFTNWREFRDCCWR